MRVFRRFAHVLLLVLTLVIGATAAAVIVTQTAWFKNLLRGYIIREAHQYLNGTISIDRLGGNLFFGIEMENIGVSMDGSQVVAVKDLGLDYNLFELISSGLSVDNLRLGRPVVYLRREGDTWSLSRLIKKQAQEADRQGPARPISIDSIGVSDGSVIVEDPVGTSGVEVPKRFDRVDAKLAFKYEPVRYSIEISHVSFRGSSPAIALNALSGGVSVRDDTVFVDTLALRTAETSMSVDGAVQQYLTKPIFNLQISSDKLSVPEFARLVPALAGIRLQPAFELKASGPLDQLGVDVNVRSSAGQLVGSMVADLLAPRQSIAGSVSVRHLDLAPILNDARQKSDITGSAKVDLSAASFSDINSLGGTASVDAPRIAIGGFSIERVNGDARIQGRRVALSGHASAYGAAATATGSVVLPAKESGAVTFDLHGRAEHVDLRRLPRTWDVPAAATNVNGDYRVAGTPTAFTGNLRFSPSTLAGAAIAEGSTAGFSINGNDIGYQGDATVSDLDLQTIGREFRVPALAADRYKSSINGHVTASGRGTKAEAMTLAAHGTLVDSSALGGRIPQMSFEASMANDAAHVKATGAVAGVDPAVISGKAALQGNVEGTLDVDVTLTGISKGVTPDTVEATGTIELQPSTIGGLRIERAAVNGDYYDSTGNIRTFEIVGRDLNATASGTLALNETGESNLTLQADSPSLDQLAGLVDQPLTGIGKVDATITGNKRALHIKGNFVGNGIKYAEHGALTMSSDFTAVVPELTGEDVRISATTDATFVTIAGQNINELTAKTDYQQKQVDFEATAKQPARSMTTNGSLVLHPDHQEVHLKALELTTAGATWRLAPGAEAAIDYSGQSVAVRGLKLVNGEQQIAADGRFGHPGDALEVALNNVDLAGVDALLLRPPQFMGRVNATGTVTGTKESPRVQADFAVNQGAFRQFRYETFGGTVNYTGRGVVVDARLQQNPTTWITANGYLPLALFTTPKEDEPRGAEAHDVAVPAEERIDFHVRSSPIDLGLVQGFTTVLTNVTGTLQANVDVTGSAGDPHPLGVITVDNAAFTVEPTGVSYTHLKGKIDLQADKVHIDEITLLDNWQSALSLTGDLALHERQVGDVHLYVTARDFKVIDNEIGNVRVNSDLELLGDLASPHLQGELGVSTGQLNVDEILALAGSSAYSTEQTEYLTPAPDETEPAAKPTMFEALKIDVHLTAPNDLVVKGQDLRTPRAPVGLGGLNVTLGGDVHATKEPGGQLTLVGFVNTVRGSYDFEGRRFDILRDGSVRFEGDTLDDLNPVLDIRASRLIQAVEARVNVRGTLRKPEIVLSSTPPLEQADILSLIVFNEPINQLGEGQQSSLVARAQQLAVGVVADELTKSIGKALNLDTFEIATASGNGSAAELIIGQQVGQNLYVKVQQGIGEQSQTNLVLEYELTRWLRLRTNVLEGSATQQQWFQRMQGSGVDLLFFFSY